MTPWLFLYLAQVQGTTVANVINNQKDEVIIYHRLMKNTAKLYILPPTVANCSKKTK